MRTTAVRPHLRRVRGGSVPIRFQLRRVRDLSPQFQDFIRRFHAKAFIDPTVDPYTVNIIGASPSQIERILSHETLHATMAHIGEKEGAAKLDFIVAGGRGKNKNGFTDVRIPKGSMTQMIEGIRSALHPGERPPSNEPSRFEGRRIESMRGWHD